MILETFESAKARGAKIYAELLGSGMNSDAYHITAPEPSGRGVIQCMKFAMQEAGLTLTRWIISMCMALLLHWAM
jgi:3-oxoacyl-[acyl-carrier-protein] synthase II